MRLSLRRRDRAPSPVVESSNNGHLLTAGWFDEATLAAVAARYADFAVPDLSYATVRDFVDSFENVHPLATAQGDLKDVQRPWVLKAILSMLPRNARIVEIGGGQPYVADLLSRLGYEVWLVDPYDGSGNGPVEFDQYRAACPRVRFVRARFDDGLADVPRGLVDGVFSISVLEHLTLDELDAVFRGSALFLQPHGVSIHVIDHVHRGRDDEEHLARLEYIIQGLGLPLNKLHRLLNDMTEDTETYYLSAESHNRWRGSLPYDDFPMRTCVSIQAAVPANRRSGRRLH